MSRPEGNPVQGNVRWCKALLQNDLWEGEVYACTLAGLPVFLVQWQHETKAYINRCPHQKLPLSPGKLQQGILTCPAHHWTFDVRTGCSLNPPQQRLQDLPVKRDGHYIWVGIHCSSFKTI